MLEVALLLARYVFLGLLYLFLGVVYRGMVRELRGAVSETETYPRSPSRPRERKTRPPPFPGTGPRWRLVVIESDDGYLAPGTFYFVEESLTFGRAPDNVVVLSDRFASGYHARLTQQPGGKLLLEDLGSTNGTQLNGQDVPELASVEVGDEIGIGTVRFRVEKG